jgi:hypothetical protein
MKPGEKKVLFDKGTDTALRTDPVVTMRDEADREKSVRAVEVSKILYRARGVWPFDFVPDEIIVEEKRIIVTINYFPWGSDIGTLPVNKLSSIEVIHALFFSSLIIQNTELHGYHATIKWLTHKDAQTIKEIVDGIKVRELSSVGIPNERASNMRRTLQTLGHI